MCADIFIMWFRNFLWPAGKGAWLFREWAWLCVKGTRNFNGTQVYPKSEKSFFIYIIIETYFSVIFSKEL